MEVCVNMYVYNRQQTVVGSFHAVLVLAPSFTKVLLTEQLTDGSHAPLHSALAGEVELQQVRAKTRTTIRANGEQSGSGRRSRSRCKVISLTLRDAIPPALWYASNYPTRCLAPQLPARHDPPSRWGRRGKECRPSPPL